jgi:hypothetical protein
MNTEEKLREGIKALKAHMKVTQRHKRELASLLKEVDLQLAQLKVERDKGRMLKG